MPVENTPRSDRPDLQVLSTDTGDHEPTPEMEGEHRRSVLHRVASGSVPVARGMAWLMLKLSFVAAPVIALYLMGVLPSDGFGTLGLPATAVENLELIGGIVVAVSHIGWGWLTLSYLISLDPERDFHWYAGRVAFFVFGIYACALTPAVVTVLTAASEAGGA